MHPLVAACQALFTGRTDVYARAYAREGYPGKVGYALVREELTEEVWDAHLRGQQLIGQYQLRPDSTVGWFALDFDAQDDAGRLVYDQAVRQLRAFEAAGLQVYLEQSRSGTGFHIWGFLNEPMAAAPVRQLLRPLLLTAESFDRLYPLQTTVSTTRPYGNLIALPFFGALAEPGWHSELGIGVPGGAGVFIEPDTLQVLDPADFCSTVYRNHSEILTELAETAPDPVTDGGSMELPRERVAPGEVEPLGRPGVPVPGVLRAISDYGCRFLSHAFLDRATLPEPEWYVALQQLTCFKHGRDAAHLISQDHPDYSVVETNEKFTHALRSPPASCRYLKEHFPSKACETCPANAPWRSGQRPIRDMVAETTDPMVRSDYRDSLLRMRRRATGEAVPGVSWGIAGLDTVTRLRAKELTVIGSMPSMGKTALMVHAAVSLASRGVPVLLFSAETGQEGLEDRLLACVSGIDSKAIKGERYWNGTILPMRPEEEIRVTEAAQTLAGWPLYTQYTATLPDNILDLVEDTVLRQRIPLGKPFVVFYDYLQFSMGDLGGRVSNEYERLSLLSQEFKYLAKILRQPVVVFSQVQRNKEAVEEPSINWFKGTGRIEADADVAMVLTGERVQGKLAPRKLTIVKQREGDVGVGLPLLLHQTVSRFELAPGASVAGQASKDLFGDDDSEPLSF